MKKLIAVLLLMVLAIVSASALAEGIAGADAAGTVAKEGNLLMDGLLVTVIGLAGVFFVLILFFLIIKLMQKLLR